LTTTSLATAGFGSPAASVRTRGVVTRFDPKRGFGFVVVERTRQKVFFHVSAIRSAAAQSRSQPAPGVVLSFQIDETDPRGPRAIEITVEDGSAWLVGRWMRLAGVWGVLAALGLVLGGVLTAWVGVRFGVVEAVAVGLVVWNGFTASLFAWDKHRSVRDGCRLPEAALLGATALGGTPAALGMMSLIRHKTRKTPFRLAMWSIVTVQSLLILVWLSRFLPTG